MNKKWYFEKDGTRVNIVERSMEDAITHIRAEIVAILTEDPNHDHLYLISEFRKLLDSEEKYYSKNQDIVKGWRKEKAEKEAAKGVIYESN